MKPRILLLALGTFAVGTEGFALAGLLPTIAGDLHVPVAIAGQLVTAFALVFALGAPLLASLTRTWPRRRLLIGALALFSAASGVAALAPIFAILLVARMLAAVGAALFIPAAVTMATSLAAPARRGQALAIVSGGSTAALALGVPLGTWCGAQFGWRATYGLVTALSLLAALGCLLFLPAVAAPAPVGLRARRALAVQPRVVLTLGVTVLGLLGWFAVYSYIALILRQVTHVQGAALSGMLLAYGLASVVGNLLGGYAADRWGPARTVAASLCGLALALAAISLLATTIPGALAALVAFGVAGWMLAPAQNARLLALSPDGAAVLVALNSSAVHLGVAGGATLGSAVIGLAGPAMLGWVGAICPLLALGVLALGMYGPRRQSASVAPLPVAQQALSQLQEG